MQQGNISTVTLKNAAWQSGHEDGVKKDVHSLYTQMPVAAWSDICQALQPGLATHQISV